MGHYNVQNDRTIGPSAGGVRNKQQTTGVGRQWLLASLQSAQSAAGAPQRVRGEEQLRPSPSLLCCSHCVTRVTRIESDVQQRPTALRHTAHGIEGLVAVRLSAPNVCERQSEGAWCMHGRASMMVWELGQCVSGAGHS